MITTTITGLSTATLPAHKHHGLLEAATKRARRDGIQSGREGNYLPGDASLDRMHYRFWTSDMYDPTWADLEAIQAAWLQGYDEGLRAS